MLSVRAAIALAALSSTTVYAQSISTPAGTNGSVATALHSAARATSTVPAAHEVPASVVNGTIPAAQPFAAGVTAAGNDVSNGIKKTGDNVNQKGVNVHPTGAVNAEEIQRESRAVNNTASRVRTAPPSAAEAECDVAELTNGKC